MTDLPIKKRRKFFYFLLLLGKKKIPQTKKVVSGYWSILSLPSSFCLATLPAFANLFFLPLTNQKKNNRCRWREVCYQLRFSIQHWGLCTQNRTNWTIQQQRNILHILHRNKWRKGRWTREHLERNESGKSIYWGLFLYDVQILTERVKFWYQNW